MHSWKKNRRAVELANAFAKNRPHIVINAAGYDRKEKAWWVSFRDTRFTAFAESERCFHGNHRTAVTLARATVS